MQRVTSQISSRTADRAEIRPLAATDRDVLAEAFSRLSPETRRRRFGTIASRLSERDLDRLTNVDHHDHEALAAVAPDSDRIVGVARYIALPNDPGAAEVAIEVADEWQGRGVGRRLMSGLLDRAREEGIDRLVAYISGDNYPVRDWIVRSEGIVQAHAGDATVYSIPLENFAEDRIAA